MLSQKEIRSMIWVEYEDGGEGDKSREKQGAEGQEQGQDEGGQQVLDISHQELRRLREIPLTDYQLKRVNASYNFFKQFSQLNFKEVKQGSQVPIHWLDLSFNFLKQIDSSSSACHILKYLRYLNVSANQLESIDFQDLQVPFLQTLNVNNNKIKYFLHCPDSLKVLMANDNLLTALAFTGGQALNILTAKNNLVKKVGLTLPLLVVFDIENNKLEEIEMVEELLGGSPQLLTINLRGNPICKSKQYKISVLDKCPNIGQIDDIIISPHIRQGFKVIKAEQQLNQMLQRVNKRYEMKLTQQRKIKNDLVKKIKQQVKNIEQQYEKGVNNEKEQLEMLQKEARKVLAKNKLGIGSETNEFKSSYEAYTGQQEEQRKVRREKDELQKQHHLQYMDFLNKRRPYSNNQIKNRIRKAKSITSKKILPEPSQPSQKLENYQNPEPQLQSMSQVSMDTDLQGIVLFDPRAIGPLLKDYIVEEIQM